MMSKIAIRLRRPETLNSKRFALAYLQAGQGNAPEGGLSRPAWALFIPSCLEMAYPILV
jgi:hypothetical protein